MRIYLTFLKFFLYLTPPLELPFLLSVCSQLQAGANPELDFGGHHQIYCLFQVRSYFIQLFAERGHDENHRHLFAIGNITVGRGPRPMTPS